MENTKCRGIVRYWLPVAAYAAFLFYVSSLSNPSVPTFPFSDKIFHLLLYAGFGLAVTRAFRPARHGWGRTRMIAVAFLGAVLYGMTDEFHQTFVSGRSAEFADLIFDGLGGFLGGFLYLLYRRVHPGGSVSAGVRTVPRDGRPVAALRPS